MTKPYQDLMNASGKWPWSPALPRDRGAPTGIAFAKGANIVGIDISAPWTCGSGVEAASPDS